MSPQNDSKVPRRQFLQTAAAATAGFTIVPRHVARLGTAMAGTFPVPDTLNWDLFLGPAPYVPYHPVCHPFNWRGWVDWAAARSATWERI